MKKATKIRQKIAALEAQLAEAQKAERERKAARFSRAAERAGLLDLNIEPAELEREFRAVAERLKVAAPATESDDTVADEKSQTPTSAETPAVAETATVAADIAGAADEKSGKKKWGWQ